MQVEVEKFIDILQDEHQKLREAGTSRENVMSEHVSFDFVEKMQKVQEEVRLEAERVTKILEYFHSKFDTSKEMEE